MTLITSATEPAGAAEKVALFGTVASVVTSSRPRAALVAGALLVGAACGHGERPVAGSAGAPSTTSTASVTHPGPDDLLTGMETGPAEANRFRRPDWLGTRPLPLRADGFGEVQPTPPELVDRRLSTIDLLPPPPDEVFAATIATVPAEVAERSTWSEVCPVALADLRYVTVTFWGFDDRPHTGELLLHAAVANDIVEVFRRLHEARFPIEEMRITEAHELDAHPTGDGNNTGAFVCRGSRGSGSWSEHAYGLAVDINPFHNPYVRGDLVLPELASAYADRDHRRPGMIQPGDVATQAFRAAGWGWGGNWRSTKDWMHFSRSGR